MTENDKEWQKMTMIKMEKSNEKGFEVIKKNAEAEGWGRTEKIKKKGEN